MKAIVLAALVIIGFGLIAASPTMAAPANGSVIGRAVVAGSVVTEVTCRWRRNCGPRGCFSRRVCWR